MTQSELQKAMLMDRNLFIEASAGTGKTYTLTKRYCAILDDFARQALENPNAPRYDPSNILVITFTRKAANEMTVKIFRDLKKLLAGKSIDEALHALGQYLRQSGPEYRLWLEGTFSRHAISTIDSFCMQVLKDYAFTAGLDPDFKVEEEVRSALFFEKELDRFLRMKASRNDPGLSRVFDEVTVDQVKQVIQYLYEHRLFLQDWLQKMDRKPKEDLENEIWRDWVQAYTPDFDEDYVVLELRRVLDALESPVYDESDAARCLLRDLQKALDAIPSGITGIELRRVLCESVLPLLMTKKKDKFLSQYKGNKLNWKYPKVLNHVKGSLKDLTDSLELEASRVCEAPNSLDQTGLQVLLAIHGLFVAFQEHMDRFQTRMGYLTFDDVILKTQSLLKQHESIRKSLSNRYIHIMVDEFQDTNDPRWDIIRMIASDEKGFLRPSGLFIVGDKKQSIYGFQQADVTVMKQARDDLAKASVKPADIVLRNNYRSTGRFIEKVVNTLFPRLFPDEESPWQAVFTPTRSAGTFPPQIDEIPQCPVLVRTMTQVPSDDMERACALNAALTAREMLAWWDDENMDEKLKKAGCDTEGPLLGILLRSFTRVGAFAAIFKRFNIPLEIVAGNSFFQRQEIFDFCYLLSFFANPHDDLALTALGRSPWLMLTDPEVDEFRDRAEYESIWSFIQRHPSLQPVKKVLQSWLDRSRTLFLPDLLEDILAEQDRELAFYSDEEGDRCLANLDLAIHLLRGLMLNGMSLRESLAWFISQRDRQSSREEAGPGGDARVCLMTIHKAKGLEFPMVILGDMNRKGRNDKIHVTHAVRDDKTDVAMNIFDEEDENLRSGVVRSIHNGQKNQEEAEELRVFYVAVTRAKFQVAFLAEFTDSNRKPSQQTPWQRYIVQGLLAELPSDPESPDWINVHDPETGISLLNRTWEDARADLPDPKIDKKNWVVPPADEGYGKPLFIITPHDIMERIHVGNPGREASGDDSELQRQYGIFFHKVMEKQWWHDLTFAETWLKDNIIDFPVLSPAKAMQRLNDDVSRLTSNPLFQEIDKTQAENAFFELPVSAAYETDKARFIIRGVVDLLYRVGDSWRILDYKTDRDLNGLSQYRVQMQLYQEMLFQAFGIQAKGLIWFVSQNHVETIQRDPAVLHNLAPDGSPAWPSPEQGKADTALMEDLVKFLDGHPTLVLCTTKTEAEEIRKNLVWRKKASPDISILSWQDLQRIQDVPGKGLDPGVRMLLCRQVLKKQQEISPMPGTARKLSEALSQAELYELTGDTISESLIESAFLAIRERSLTTDGDILHHLKENHPFKGMDVYLTGWYQPSPLRHQLMSSIARDAHRFRMPGSNHIPDVYAWKKLDDFECRDHHVVVCNRSEDEVRTVFREIISRQPADLHSCHIAVSNPSEYEPLIRRIADEYHIPVSFSTRIPLKQTPLGHYFLNLITLIENIHQADWVMIAPVLLDPIVQPSQSLYRLDLYLRQNALESPDAIRLFLDKKGKPEHESCRDIYDRVVVRLLENIASLKSISRCLDYLKQTMDKIPENLASNDGMDLDQKVRETLDRLIRKTIPSLQMVGVDEGEMKQEGLILLREWINQEEIPRRDRQQGIPVTGFLDTMNLEPNCLWLLGLNQTDFPVRMLRNPFFSEPPYNPWYLNRRMLNHWCRLKEVRFMASKSLSNSAATEPSALLEAFEQVSPPEIHTIKPGRRSLYHNFSSAMIDPAPDLPAIRRHNEWMKRQADPERKSDGMSGLYHGLARPVKLPHKTSATQVEHLVVCPMRYWFSEILNLRQTDADKQGKENKELGGFVHAILYRFGEEGGFTRPEKEAISLMKQVVDEELKKRDHDPETDIWAKQRFRFLTRGLDENPPKGKMADLVRKNLEILHAFNRLDNFFEQKFDNPESSEDLRIWPALKHKAFEDLILKGTIDKVFVDHEKKQILISDYKTGSSYSVKDVADGFNIQPLVYYLKVKEAFPGYQTVFVYESIPKNHKPYEMSKEIGDTGDKGLFVQASKPYRIEERKGVQEDTLSLEKIIGWFQEAADHLKKGTFPHTSKDRFKKACTYCEFAYLCRKEDTN
jgi:ATP-dependent exoDNAse (exonuclease V) beta subunit